MSPDEEQTEPSDKAAAASPRRRKPRRKKGRQAKGEWKAAAKPGGLRQRSFPREPLEKALRVPAAISEKNGGKPWPPTEVANALGGISSATPGFFYLAGAARDYGLTDGGRDSKTIALTDLGRRAVYPGSKEEEAATKLTAFRNVKAFADVLAHYGGNRLPELQYLKNTLTAQFGIEPAHHAEFVKIFKANCLFVGLGDGQAVSEQAVPDRRAAAALKPVGAVVRVDDAGGTITLAEPDANAPVCFVIMPFTERDPKRAPNFFSEVLTRLITPACVDAGFRVVTANRRGSDVIHSTIVNSLLDADLVVCDLTDHNPNVLFELGMRMHHDRPVALIQADGTTRIFDVDNVLRVLAYNPNLWSSTLETDKPALTGHVKATWDGRETARTYMKLLRPQA